MVKFLRLFSFLFILFGVFQIQAQSSQGQIKGLIGCKDTKVVPGTFQEKCEYVQIVEAYKQDSVIVFSQNAYISEELVNGKICKIAYPAKVIKKLAYIPVLSTIKICEVQATGGQVFEIYSDCK